MAGFQDCQQVITTQNKGQDCLFDNPDPYNLNAINWKLTHCSSFKNRSTPPCINSVAALITASRDSSLPVATQVV